MIDRKEIVDQVAARYGVRIAVDDPLLVWLAVHDVVIERYVEGWREVQAEARIVADAEAAGKVEDAAATAKALQARVDVAAKAAAEGVADQVAAAVTDATASFRTAAEAAAVQVNAAQRRTLIAAAVAVAFPAGTVVALIAWLVAM